MREHSDPLEVNEASTAKREVRVASRVWWELRHARCRLALAECELAWAQAALTDGYMNASAALEILDSVMESIAGVRP
jgi:hypothetical protein